MSRTYPITRPKPRRGMALSYSANELSTGYERETRYSEIEVSLELLAEVQKYPKLYTCGDFQSIGFSPITWVCTRTSVSSRSEGTG